MTRYSGTPQFKHDEAPCTGVLITNLGTPDAPTPAAVRRYLAEFLWDPRVIEMPRVPWWLILHGIILNTRPRRSAHAYQKVWTAEGSPLLHISQRQATALQAKVQALFHGPVKIQLAMRYGQPSIRQGLENLRAAGARRILVLPLYPQYSAPATASTFDAVADVLKQWRWIPELRMVSSYHDEPAYVEAIANSIRAAWRERTPPQKLLFSFHGIPKDYFTAGDPYFCQCQQSARLIAQALGLDAQAWQVSFQSRLGPREWLQPYTDATLRTLAQAGCRSVDVICPGFSADCLETIEEIDLQNRDVFLQAGGIDFRYITALNDRDDHIEALAAIVRKHTQGWPETNPDWNQQDIEQACAARLQRARRMGASQ